MANWYKPRGYRYTTKKEVLQFDLDGELVGRYDSIQQASEAVGRSHSAIGRCLKGDWKTSAGYKWRYANED